jgi:hypothetical protein
MNVGLTNMSCPKCGRVFSEKELAKILKASGASKKVIEKVKKQIISKEVATEL